MRNLAITCFAVLILSAVLLASNAPVIASVSINYSTNQIAITGSNFTVTDTVTFGGTTLSVVSVNSTVIVANLPVVAAGFYELDVIESPGKAGQISIEYGSETPALTFSTFCSLVPNGANPPLYQFGNNYTLSSTGCAKIVFVTSTVFTGNLGGVLGADAFCQQAANSRGIPGQYKAWLDGSTLTAVPFQYILVDNTKNLPTISLAVVANDWVDISNGVLLLSIDETELRTNVSGVTPWTGQDSHGAPTTGLTCQEWTSNLHSDGGTIGSTRATDVTWSNSGSRNCDVPQPLFCFQQ